MKAVLMHHPGDPVLWLLIPDHQPLPRLSERSGDPAIGALPALLNLFFLSFIWG
jgi:hypothetical protein